MINEVRNAVLSVLNKNNYGYLSPSDFNLFAQNAQMELYEEYFSSYNKAINFENQRLAGDDYADMELSIAETIESFLRTDVLPQVAPDTNEFYYPSLTSTGYDSYMVNNVQCYGPNGEAWGQAEKVSNGKIYLLLNSSLTKPTTMFPAYVLKDSTVTVYPESIKDGTVKMTYFRYPKVPKWTYRTLANGEPVFDQSQPDYQDFELPSNDNYKLVMKILQYAGVSIREFEVMQYAMAQEQHEQPTFSQKQ